MINATIKNRAANLRGAARRILSVNLFALIVATLSLAITYWEYLQHEQELKIERSLDYFQNFSSSTWIERRAIIDEAFDDLRPKLEELSRSNKNANHIESEYSKIVLAKVTSEPNLRHSIDSLIEFYGGLLTCSRLQLCDEDTIDRFFATPAKTFFRQVHPYLYYLRQDWGDNSLGQELEQYALAR